MCRCMRTPSSGTELDCRGEIDRMLKNSQTKAIMPVLTFGLLSTFQHTGQTVFTDREIKAAYESAVKTLRAFLGHDFHIGAKY